MLRESINGKKWITQSIEKLKKYLNRAPILVSDIIGTENCKDGVFIVIDSIKKKMFFPFDFDIEPKLWVHNIKETLVNFYPRLLEDIKEVHTFTPDEQALIVEKQASIDNIPIAEDRVVKQNCWRIDKVLCYRDIFILYLEGTFDMGTKRFLPSEKPIMRRFKYMGSSVLFLKKQRSVVPNGENDAELNALYKDFFENSVPLDDVEIKNF